MGEAALRTLARRGFLLHRRPSTLSQTTNHPVPAKSCPLASRLTSLRRADGAPLALFSSNSHRRANSFSNSRWNCRPRAVLGARSISRSLRETGDTLAVNAILEVGCVTESIEVSAATQLLETETSATGDVISGETMYDLPMFQRYTELGADGGARRDGARQSAPQHAGRVNSRRSARHHDCSV